MGGGANPFAQVSRLLISGSEYIRRWLATSDNAYQL
jgi:hypothetical protein